MNIAACLGLILNVAQFPENNRLHSDFPLLTNRYNNFRANAVSYIHAQLLKESSNREGCLQTHVSTDELSTLKHVASKTLNVIGCQQLIFLIKLAYQNSDKPILVYLHVEFKRKCVTLQFEDSIFNHKNFLRNPIDAMHLIASYIDAVKEFEDYDMVNEEDFQKSLYQMSHDLVDMNIWVRDFCKGKYGKLCDTLFEDIETKMNDEKIQAQKSDSLTLHNLWEIEQARFKNNLKLKILRICTLLKSVDHCVNALGKIKRTVDLCPFSERRKWVPLSTSDADANNAFQSLSQWFQNDFLDMINFMAEVTVEITVHMSGSRGLQISNENSDLDIVLVVNAKALTHIWKIIIDQIIRGYLVKSYTARDIIFVSTVEMIDNPIEVDIVVCTDPDFILKSDEVLELMTNSASDDENVVELYQGIMLPNQLYDGKSEYQIDEDILMPCIKLYKARIRILQGLGAPIPNGFLDVFNSDHDHNLWKASIRHELNLLCQWLIKSYLVENQNLMQKIKPGRKSFESNYVSSNPIQGAMMLFHHAEVSNAVPECFPGMTIRLRCKLIETSKGIFCPQILQDKTKSNDDILEGKLLDLLQIKDLNLLKAMILDFISEDKEFLKNVGRHDEYRHFRQTVLQKLINDIETRDGPTLIEIRHLISNVINQQGNLVHFGHPLIEGRKWFVMTCEQFEELRKEHENLNTQSEMRL